MNNYYDDRGTGAEFAKNNDGSDMSLNSRREQVEFKVNRQMNSNNSANNVYPSADVQMPKNNGVNTAAGNYRPNNNVQAAQIPAEGSPYGTYNGPYGVTRDYTNGLPYNPQYTKKRYVGGGTKIFLGVIVALSVAFTAGFVIECARASATSDPFSIWDFDEYLDTDFGIIDTDSDSGYVEDESDSEYDQTDNDIIDAPDPETLINANAGNITVADQPDNLDSTEYNAQKAFKEVEKSVVAIVTYTGKVGIQEEAEGEGTGIIVSEDGYIVTNSHVISDTKDIGVEVVTSDGKSYIATVVGYDSRTDLALLKINATGLKPVEFVNSDQIEVGQDALAVGNPGGIEYSNSLTRGAVSAVNRTVSSNSVVSYIQTDAAINPGNSGGPLLNIAGQVMGINTIKIVNTEYEGMGFAIPSNTVIEIINDLMKQGYISDRVRIGIVGQAISSYIASIYDVPQGIMIDEFAEDSPFIGTDAKVNDIITAINGESIKNFTQLYSELAKYKPGQKITVTLFRANQSGTGGKSIDVQITLLPDNGETQEK